MPAACARAAEVAVALASSAGAVRPRLGQWGLGALRPGGGDPAKLLRLPGSGAGEERRARGPKKVTGSFSLPGFPHLSDSSAVEPVSNAGGLVWRCISNLRRELS